MRAKKIVTIILTLVVFFTAAFLGVSAVYRIEEVTLVLDHVSMPALEEAAALIPRRKKKLRNFRIFALRGLKKIILGAL